MDGSKLHARCGSGYVIYNGKLTIAKGAAQLPDEATVFQAEINANNLACKDMFC